jgi:hypothetical protein
MKNFLRRIGNKRREKSAFFSAAVKKSPSALASTGMEDPFCLRIMAPSAQSFLPNKKNT